MLHQVNCIINFLNVSQKVNPSFQGFFKKKTVLKFRTAFFNYVFWKVVNVYRVSDFTCNTMLLVSIAIINSSLVGTTIIFTLAPSLLIT